MGEDPEREANADALAWIGVALEHDFLDALLLRRRQFGERFAAFLEVPRDQAVEAFLLIGATVAAQRGRALAQQRSRAVLAVALLVGQIEQGHDQVAATLGFDEGAVFGSH
nr:hypothetical protein [Cerasicoccus maritimus]